jgi:hypothetical protein
MWCEAYLERMEDVLEIYERPYNPLVAYISETVSIRTVLWGAFQAALFGPSKSRLQPKLAALQDAE